MSTNANRNMLVDDETRADILEYFPTLMDKKIYYQLLTQHVKFDTTFQDDTCFLNKISSDCHVPPSVQKRLDQIEHDWNVDPFMLPKVPKLYLEESSLFLDDSNLFSQFEARPWNWQEKSKCFPLIQTTRADSCSSMRDRQEKDSRKPQFSRSVVQKLAIFDPALFDTKHVTRRPDNPDYGRKLSELDSRNANATTTAAEISTATRNKKKQPEAVRNNNKQLEAARNFNPFREVDMFMKQKQHREQ